jgi:hypothetical protein
VDRYHDLGRLSLDLDICDRRVIQPRVQVIAQLLILGEKGREIPPLRIPTRLPGLYEPQPEAVRMCLLAHNYSFVSTTTVT